VAAMSALVVGQGDALEIDLRDFMLVLYRSLASLLRGRDAAGDTVVQILRAVDDLVMRQRHASHKRVLAFAKRLCSASLMVTANAAAAMLLEVRQMLLRFRVCERMLDAESGTSARFLHSVDDPDLSNADGAVAWELTLLAQHADPVIRHVARHVAHGAQLNALSGGSGVHLAMELQSVAPVALLQHAHRYNGVLTMLRATPTSCLRASRRLPKMHNAELQAAAESAARHFEHYPSS
jgi:hypothetical protein